MYKYSHVDYIVSNVYRKKFGKKGHTARRLSDITQVGFT